MSFSLSPFRRASNRPSEHGTPGSALPHHAVTSTTPEVDSTLPTLPGPTTESATYRSLAPREWQPYRGAIVTAVVLFATGIVIWVAGPSVLANVESAAGWLHEHDNPLRRTLVVLALWTAGALAIIVAWGRATSPAQPVALAGGRGMITPGQIAAWLASALEERPGIRTASVTVENRHSAGVRVDVRVRVGPDAHIDATLDAVDDAAEELLHRRLGVAMDGPPLVDVVYNELQLRAGKPHD